MLLYHATSDERAELILSQGIIDNNAKPIYTLKTVCADGSEVNLATTKGYIYLTDSIPKALYFGYSASKLTNRMFYTIFKIDISEQNLLPDLDELYMMYNICEATAKQSLKICRCVRIDRCLNIKDMGCEYITVPSMTYSQTKDKSLDDIIDFSRDYMNLRDCKGSSDKKLGIYEQKFNHLFKWNKLE